MRMNPTATTPAAREGLDRIAMGDAVVAEAASILQSALQDPKNALAIVVALRAWTWKALTNRRQDRALVDWHGLIERVGARLQAVDPKFAAQAEILSQLVYESIASSDISDVNFVLQRSHVRQGLAILSGAKDGKVLVAKLASDMRLTRTNGTRIANMMVAAGLATLDAEGDDATLEITRSGEAVAGGLVESGALA